MSLGDQWISCRQNSSNRNKGIPLLPQFNVQHRDTDFALESRSLHLSPSNSALRVLGAACTSGMCVVGTLVLLLMVVGPAVRGGSKVVNVVSDSVGSALAYANDHAEQRVQDHSNARYDYMRRRGLVAREEAPTITEQPDQGAQQTQRPKAGKSTLLLRMAALLRVESSVGGIDYKAVEQYFPGWIGLRRRRGECDEDAVLRYLVLAVSQLANTASVDSGENT